MPQNKLLTNPVQQVVKDIADLQADVAELQGEIGSGITNPYVGTLRATDFASENIPSVQTAIIELQNSGSGDVSSSAINSKNNSIVRFDGLTGKIIQSYSDNSLAPIVSDEGYLNIYNNFNQTRENVNANSIQTVYGDRNSHQGNMEFRSLSAKDSIDNITNNRALGAIRFTGGVETTQKYNGAIIETRTAQNWTDTEHGSYFVIKTAKNGEDLISDRLKIDKDGDLIITDNLVAQDLYISGTRTTTLQQSDPNGPDSFSFNSVNYATQGVSVSGELNSLKEKTIKLTNTGDIMGSILTDQTTFLDDQELITKKYVDTAVSGIPPADLSDLEAKTQNISLTNTDGTTTFMNQKLVLGTEGGLRVSAISGQGLDTPITDVSPLLVGVNGFVFTVKKDIVLTRLKVKEELFNTSSFPNVFVDLWDYNTQLNQWEVYSSKSLSIGTVGNENGYRWTENGGSQTLSVGTRYGILFYMDLGQELSDLTQSPLTIGSDIEITGSVYRNVGQGNNFPENETTDGNAPVGSFDYTSVEAFDKSLNCGSINCSDLNTNNINSDNLTIDSTNMTIDSDLLTINAPIDMTDFAKYQGIDYLNPSGNNILAAVGYVNQSIANIPPTDLSSIETDISALQDKTSTLSIVNDDTRINGDFEVEKEVRKIKLYPHSPPGYASELGGITLTGVLGNEYPFIIYDAWDGGGGFGDIDYIRFFVGSGSGGEVFNIQPNLMVLNGDLGNTTDKVPNIHCGQLFYTQLNQDLRNGPIENVNISDTFLFLNDKIEKEVGSFVNFGGDESNIFADRSYFNLNGESTSQTSSSVNYDNTFLCPCDCKIKSISFIKRNDPLSSVQVVINRTIDELHVFDLFGKGDVVDTDIQIQKGDTINLCFRNTNGAPGFGRYTLYLVSDSSSPSAPTTGPITLNFDESDLLPPSKSLEDRIEELEQRLNELVN